MKWIDLTRPLQDQMPVYPGDTAPVLTKTHDYSADGFTDHRLVLGMHTGTHIDGPMHLTDSKIPLSELPPDKFIGEACILDARDESPIRIRPGWNEKIKSQSIVLIYTGFCERFGTDEYFQKYPSIHLDLAEHLVSKKIKILALDSPSPDYPPHPIHRFLLSHEVLIAENLCNFKPLLEAERFEITALPLKIQADSSPARIVARIID